MSSLELLQSSWTRVTYCGASVSISISHQLSSLEGVLIGLLMTVELGPSVTGMECGMSNGQLSDDWSMILRTVFRSFSPTKRFKKDGLLNKTRTDRMDGREDVEKECQASYQGVETRTVRISTGEKVCRDEVKGRYDERRTLRLNQMLDR
jgi:hypothetical protein